MKSKEIILDDHVFTYFQDGELFIENPTTEATIHLKAAEVLQLLGRRVSHK